jgi:hypothetical protein
MFDLSKSQIRTVHTTIQNISTHLVLFSILVFFVLISPRFCSALTREGEAPPWRASPSHPIHSSPISPFLHPSTNFSKFTGHSQHSSGIPKTCEPTCRFGIGCRCWIVSWAILTTNSRSCTVDSTAQRATSLLLDPSFSSLNFPLQLLYYKS